MPRSTRHVDAGGAELSVTLRRVIDRLRDSGAQLPPAARAVGLSAARHLDRYITAAADRVGCGVFAVADRAMLDAVRFSPHAKARGRLSWAP
jgi:hypothetical protein